MTGPTDHLQAALQHWRDLDPLAPALSDGVTWLSRGALGQRLAAGRRVLRQAGLGPSDRVAVLMPQGFEGALVALQVASTCSLAPLRPGMPAERWRVMLAELAPAALVLAAESDPALAAAAVALAIPLLPAPTLLRAAPGSPHRPAAASESSAAEPPEEPPDEPAGEPPAEPGIVIATSGTTGTPKWVQHAQSSLLRGCRATAESLALTAADRALLALPLHHVHGLVSGLLMPLCSGGSVVVTERFEAAAALACIADQEISWISLPPAMHQALLDQHRRTPLAAGHRLRFLRSGAISLPPQLIADLQAAFGVPVIEAYGMSECPHICGNPIAAPQPGGVGKPVVEELVIVDGAGRPLPPGRWGQVVVRGAPVMRGYLAAGESPAAPEGSAAAFAAGWLPTGDMGRLDGEGYLELRGRLSERINRGGLEVMPAVVDAALLRHPAVREAVAFPVPHPSLGHDLAAAVVLHPGAALAEQSLRRHALASLAAHEVPSRIVVVAGLPTGATGKVERMRLAEQLAAVLAPDRQLPTGELERLVAATFAAVLRQPMPGRRANFFQLGGDSLSGMRVMQALEQRLALVLPPSLLFACPSAFSLAERLERIRRERQGEGDDAPPGAAAAPTTIPAAIPLPGEGPPGCQAFPASHAQARLWFLHQLQPDLTAYHLPALWRLSGNLDLNALRLALADLIERHPTLRTSFELQGGEVVQLIHPFPSFPLEPEPLADRNPDAVIEQWLEQEGSAAFDLSSGQLLRARLLAIDHQNHLLLLNHHHIASDGWSRSVLVRDLTELYNAHRSGRAPELPPLRVHYHDYAAWQRQRLSGDRQQSLKDYWIPQLTGLEPLELPSDHPRPLTPSHRGASATFQISPELLTPFEDLCRSEGATLQMGLLAVVALLLHRTSRQDDLAIGVPIWGRNHPDLEPLIGFFVNTLPIRTRFSAKQSFRQLLQQVKATSLAAYDHQELPFEQMVEVLNLERDTSRTPLVQVMLQLIELPEASLQGLAELESEMLVGRPTAAKLDLEFYLRRTEQGGLRAEVVYATELFAGERMERMSTHLLTLLASALGEPDANAASLGLLPDGERQLIESWQHGPAIDVPDLCVHQLFEQQVERTPDAIALIFEDQQLTYADLHVRSNQLAHHLIALGVGPEVIVAVCLERSAELIVSLLAILKAGGAYLPLDPSWPKERHALLLTEAACSVLINRDGARVVDGPSPRREAGSGSPLAYLSYTSGSTGKPKGVAITHQPIRRLVDPANGFLLSAGQRVLQLAPVAFDAATFEIWGPLLNGGTLVVAPPEQPTLPALAALVKSHGITTLWLTAGLFHAMVEAELPALAGVQQILAGGDVLSAAHVQRLLAAFPPGHALINGYGPTENTTFTCCHTMEAGARIEVKVVAIGRPIANTDVWVLDVGGQPCPIGIPGELHIGGAGLARGYLNNPELTAETFIPNRFSADPTARLYKSGDLVSWNPDGTLAFHGRIDQQIKLRGFRIEPGEIETNLLAHPAVAQAVVQLRHDDPSNPRLIAYWVADAAQPTTASASSEQLGAFLSERLPEFMVPAAFLQLESLPLTANGKLDRKALPATSFSGNLDQRLAPSTDLERQLHALWAEVLGHSDFGVSDNFFLVGGHSLAAARLLAAIEESFAISLPMATLFHFPEIRLMARRMESTDHPLVDGNSCLVPLQPHGKSAPLFVIHGYGGDVFCYTGFARALAPDRPVYGLQAMGIDGTSARHRSVEEMAAHYATLIDQQWPSGELHLLGQSAGGWVVWAVAAALLRLGRRIGMVAILDSGPTAAIALRLRWSLLVRRTLRRLPTYIDQLSHSKRPRHLLAFLRQRRQQLATHLRWFQPQPFTLPPANPPSQAGEERLDYYDLLHRRYRPISLPLRVHLFLARHDPRLKYRLWRAMACRGVVLRQLFEEHHHFHAPSLAGQLAAAIDETLTQIEAESRSTQSAAGLE